MKRKPFSVLYTGMCTRCKKDFEEGDVFTVTFKPRGIYHQDCRDPKGRTLRNRAKAFFSNLVEFLDFWGWLQ